MRASLLIFAFAAVGFAQTEADRVLFFDDLPANVEGARAAGMQAVLVRSPDDVAQALQSWLGETPTPP